MSLSFRSVVMDIADIKVPFDSLPKTEKIKECYAFFRKYGLLDRQIIVDGDNVLRDGLVGLMVARAVDLKQLKVLRVREKTKALYESSEIHSYLNSTFLNLFESNIRDAIK